MSQSHPRRSMSVVIFTPKASHIRIPEIKMMAQVFLLESPSFQSEKRARKALTLKNISAGSSFISFACWNTVIGIT